MNFQIRITTKSWLRDQIN